MSDLNTEIKITASADGVETGVARAKRSLAGLKEEATRSGAEAGRGMTPLGDGAEAAARKVDSATRNMQASLQRQIAALEAGGTATRQYQESLAKLRGVDANALKPLLDQLDAAKAKADRAGQGLNGLGAASSFLQGQLAALAGSLTLGSMAAFVLQINNGIDALNDIKDATGSTIENISALEDIGKRTGASLDLVGGVLIKFNDVLSKAGPKSDIALQLQAIGLSAEELKRIDPAEALLKTAQALSQYADDGNKARLIQDLFGKSVKDAAPFLADLAEKGQLVAKVTAEQADEAGRFNKQLFEMQANIQEASRRLAGPLVSAINEVAKAFREGSASGKGFFEIASDRYWSNVRGFYNGEGVMSGSRPVRNPREATGTIRVEAGAAATEPPKPSIVLGPTAAEIAEQERRERERQSKAEAAARAAAALREREFKEQQKFFADLAGLSGDYYDKLAQAQKERAAGNITEAQYIEYVEQLIQKQPFATALTRDNAAVIKAQAAAAIEAAKASAAYYGAIGQDLARLEEQNQRLREEGEQIGLSAQGLLALTLARQDHAIAIEAERLALLQANEGSAGEILLQERRIALLKEQRALTAANGQRQIATEAAKEAATAWQRASDDIERSLTDALMRGFESGKGFAEVLRDTVANMFKTLVLRPIVSAVVSPVAGAITGSLGLPGAANAASSVSSGYNMLSNAGSFIGTSVFGGAGAYASGLGLSSAAAGSQAAMLAAQTGSFGAAGLAATAQAAGTAGTAAASAASAASSIAAAAPWLLGGLAVAALIKSLDDSGTYHTGGLGSYSAAGGSAVGDAVKGQGLGFDLASRDYTASSQQAAVAMAKTIAGLLDQTASTFGQQAGYFAATAFADDTSKDGAWGALMVKLGDQIAIDWKNGTDRWPGREFANGEAGAKEYAAAVAKDVRDYLITQTPDWADAALNALGESPTLDALSATVGQINQVQTALTTMGDASKAFATVGEDVASRLVSALGGAQAAAASMASYYGNFYSDTERQSITRQQFSTAAATIGITDLPTTRAAYRQLVDSTLVAGQTEVAAKLIQYSDVFASFTENVATSTASLQQSSAAVVDNSQLKSLQAEERNLRIQEAQAYGNTAEEIRLLTEGMTDFEAELFLSNRSLAENIAAQQRVNSLRDEATNLQADLLRARGDEAGALALLTQNMGEAERAQYLRNEALRDEIAAVEVAKEAARQLTADMQALASAADSAAPKLLSGNALAAFQNDRIAEQLNAALGSSLTGVNLAALGIDDIKSAVLAFVQSGAAPAAKTALLQLAGSLIDLKQSAIDAQRATALQVADTAFAGVERAIASQRKLAETSRTAAEKLKTEVQGIFDTLQSSVDELFGSVDSTRALQATQAQQYISAALAAARATGAMPDGKELTRAITAARGGLDTDQFRTQAEADFARLVLANELRDLQAISGDQLTEAERQVQAAEDMLTYLDSTYETAKQQLDELKGVNVGVNITLPAALAAFAQAIGQARPLSQTITSSTGGTYSMATGIGKTADGQVWDVATVKSAAVDLASAQGAAAVYDAIRTSGYTLAQAEKIFGSPAGSLEEEARKLGLPVFHNGTDYVERTGYALLQQGEAVVPAAYNPAATPGFTGGNTERLERLVEGLTAEVQRLQAIVNDGNTHQRRTADTLENVTEGGANMRTVAAT